VHVLLGFVSMLLIFLGSYLLLRTLRRVNDWSQRRMMQLAVLAMPSVILGLGVGGLHHFIGRLCLLGAPLWDILLGALLPLGMTGVALSAFGLGIVRLILMRRVVTRNAVFVHPDLQTRVDELGQLLHSARPRVVLCLYNRPLAFTCGIFRSTILLSTWMVEHLDQHELEAVLVHEMEHVARRDYLVVWLSMVLRDAFFYLPMCRIAYRQLQHEKELACDELTVGVTRRPLALASALAKVWQNVVAEPRFAAFGAAQPLVKGEELIHGRIERLLSFSASKTTTQSSRATTFSAGIVALGTLLVVQSTNIIIIMALMRCNPLALLEKLF